MLKTRQSGSKRLNCSGLCVIEESSRVENFPNGSEPSCVLENSCTRKGTGGSNPSPSAKFSSLLTYEGLHEVPECNSPKSPQYDQVDCFRVCCHQAGIDGKRQWSFQLLTSRLLVTNLSRPAAQFKRGLCAMFPVIVDVDGNAQPFTILANSPPTLGQELMAPYRLSGC